MKILLIKTQKIRGALYEEKIINFIKSKINLSKKELTTQDADNMISKLNTNKVSKVNTDNKAKKKHQNQKKKNK